MARKSMELAVATDPAWVEVVLDNFHQFLPDHANCERKASALAMSMVVKYPDRHQIIPWLIELAQEELNHFSQVYQIMKKRGLGLVKDEPDPYVNALLKHMRTDRNDRFVDRMLISSIIECRGAERFRMISKAVTDENLRTFYRDLWAAEAKHGHQFVAMLLNFESRNTVYKRLHELTEIEGGILKNLIWRPALH